MNKSKLLCSITACSNTASTSHPRTGCTSAEGGITDGVFELTLGGCSG